MSQDKKGPPKAVTTGRKITMAEVEQHASKDSVWFVRDGKVRREAHLRTQSPASKHTGKGEECSDTGTGTGWGYGQLRHRASSAPEQIFVEI